MIGRCAAVSAMRRVLQEGYAAPFAGADDQEIVLALVTVGAGKAMGQGASVEVAAEGGLDIRGWQRTGWPGGAFQPGFEVGLDDAIPQRPLGTAALVALGSGRSAWSGGCHRVGPS